MRVAYSIIVIALLVSIVDQQAAVAQATDPEQVFGAIVQFRDDGVFSIDGDASSGVSGEFRTTNGEISRIIDDCGVVSARSVFLRWRSRVAEKGRDPRKANFDNTYLCSLWITRRQERGY